MIILLLGPVLAEDFTFLENGSLGPGQQTRHDLLLSSPLPYFLAVVESVNLRKGLNVSLSLRLGFSNVSCSGTDFVFCLVPRTTWSQGKSELTLSCRSNYCDFILKTKYLNETELLSGATIKRHFGQTDLLIYKMKLEESPSHLIFQHNYFNTPFQFKAYAEVGSIPNASASLVAQAFGQHSSLMALPGRQNSTLVLAIFGTNTELIVSHSRSLSNQTRTISVDRKEYLYLRHKQKTTYRVQRKDANFNLLLTAFKGRAQIEYKRGNQTVVVEGDQSDESLFLTRQELASGSNDFTVSAPQTDCLLAIKLFFSGSKNPISLDLGRKYIIRDSHPVFHLQLDPYQVTQASNIRFDLKALDGKEAILQARAFKTLNQVKTAFTLNRTADQVWQAAIPEEQKEFSLTYELRVKGSTSFTLKAGIGISCQVIRSEQTFGFIHENQVLIYKLSGDFEAVTFHLLATKGELALAVGNNFNQLAASNQLFNVVQATALSKGGTFYLKLKGVSSTAFVIYYQSQRVGPIPIKQDSSALLTVNLKQNAQFSFVSKGNGAIEVYCAEAELIFEVKRPGSQQFVEFERTLSMSKSGVYLFQFRNRPGYHTPPVVRLGVTHFSSNPECRPLQPGLLFIFSLGFGQNLCFNYSLDSSKEYEFAIYAYSTGIVYSHLTSEKLSQPFIQSTRLVKGTACNSSTCLVSVNVAGPQGLSRVRLIAQEVSSKMKLPVNCPFRSKLVGNRSYSLDAALSPGQLDLVISVLQGRLQITVQKESQTIQKNLIFQRRLQMSPETGTVVHLNCLGCEFIITASTHQRQIPAQVKIQGLALFTYHKRDRGVDEISLRKEGQAFCSMNGSEELQQSTKVSRPGLYQISCVQSGSSPATVKVDLLKTLERVPPQVAVLNPEESKFIELFSGEHCYFVFKLGYQDVTAFLFAGPKVRAKGFLQNGTDVSNITSPALQFKEGQLKIQSQLQFSHLVIEVILEEELDVAETVAMLVHDQSNPLFLESRLIYRRIVRGESQQYRRREGSGGEVALLVRQGRVSVGNTSYGKGGHHLQLGQQFKVHGQNTSEYQIGQFSVQKLDIERGVSQFIEVGANQEHCLQLNNPLAGPVHLLVKTVARSSLTYDLDPQNALVRESRGPGLLSLTLSAKQARTLVCLRESRGLAVSMQVVASHNQVSLLHHGQFFLWPLSQEQQQFYGDWNSNILEGRFCDDQTSLKGNYSGLTLGPDYFYLQKNSEQPLKVRLSGAEGSLVMLRQQQSDAKFGNIFQNVRINSPQLTVLPNQHFYHVIVGEIDFGQAESPDSFYFQVFMTARLNELKAARNCGIGKDFFHYATQEFKKSTNYHFAVSRFSNPRRQHYLTGNLVLVYKRVKFYIPLPTVELYKEKSDIGQQRLLVQGLVAAGLLAGLLFCGVRVWQKCRSRRGHIGLQEQVELQ